MSEKFDFGRFLSLGREVSEVHPDFKELAPLGNEAAEMRAGLMVFIALKKARNNGEQPLTLEEKATLAIDLLGKAQFLNHVKEVGRMCLILGDTSKKEDWTD